MTTASRDYAQAQLPSSSSAFSIAQADSSAENNGGGPLPVQRRTWRTPPTLSPEDPRIPSWPALSRDGAAQRNPPLIQPHEATAMATPACSSTGESVSGGDPITSEANPLRQQQVERGSSKEPHLSSDSALVATESPALLPVPRQQQGRIPQNGRRGRIPPYQHNGYPGGNGGHPQQRQPHQPRNLSFSHQPHPQFVNGGFFHHANPQMMGFPNLPPEWGSNAMPIVHWGSNPRLATPYMGAIASQVGSQFSDTFSYPVPPHSLTVPPPLGWNPPWTMARMPSLTEVTLQNQIHPGESATFQGEDMSSKLRKQIEYYFSDDNLVRDLYLRRCMDDQGWVSVQIIANFPRVPFLAREGGTSVPQHLVALMLVKRLTSDLDLVLRALQASDAVEVSADKFRKKVDWSKWVLPQHLREELRGQVQSSA